MCPAFLHYIHRRFALMQLCRFFGVASAKELGASDTACASPYEMQCGSRSHAPPAAHTSPLSLNMSAPHPHIEASVTNVVDADRDVRGATGLLPNNGHSQRLPCLSSCPGRPPAPSLSCNSTPLCFESLWHTAFREKECSNWAPQWRLGLAVAVVVFALRQCNRAHSQPGGFPFYSDEGHTPNPP
ncbi:hypothetical protein TRVL_04615 [Trypanosoma vivax]|nr:hypothetical protein TRVL_04615 [Trypanosoma vivax]